MCLLVIYSANPMQNHMQLERVRQDEDHSDHAWLIRSPLSLAHLSEVCVCVLAFRTQHLLLRPKPSRTHTHTPTKAAQALRTDVRPLQLAAAAWRCEFLKKKKQKHHTMSTCVSNGFRKDTNARTIFQTSLQKTTTTKHWNNQPLKLVKYKRPKTNDKHSSKSRKNTFFGRVRSQILDKILSVQSTVVWKRQNKSLKLQIPVSVPQNVGQTPKPTHSQWRETPLAVWSDPKTFWTWSTVESKLHLFVSEVKVADGGQHTKKHASSLWGRLWPTRVNRRCWMSIDSSSFSPDPLRVGREVPWTSIEINTSAPTCSAIIKVQFSCWTSQRLSGFLQFWWRLLTQPWHSVSLSAFSTAYVSLSS